jgi:N-acetylmuramoyl-L-alanine amidase
MGNRLIVLDPGHGGADPGAIGANGVHEKRINLFIAQEVRRLLEAAGIEVLMTLDTDRGLTLAERAAITNRADADCIVSIHANASGTADPERKARGIETYCLPGGTAKVLADIVHEFMVRATGAPDRGVRTNRAFYMLRRTAPPAILVETGYLTNVAECALLSEPTYRFKLALAIALGVIVWLKAVKG